MITYKGNPLILVGQVSKKKAGVSDFKIISHNLKNVNLSDFKDKMKIITTSRGRCKPCEGGIPPLPKENVDTLMAQHKGWELVEDRKIIKEFRFNSFLEAKYFLDLVSILAEEQGHHPTMTLIYNKLKITLTTHAAGGLTENDFIIAGIIDELRGGG